MLIKSANIKAVLFDLDGTLLDTAPDLAKALNIVLQHYARPELPFAQIRPYASTGTRGLLGLGFGIDESHADYALLREQFLNAYHQHLYDASSIFPGVIPVLEYLAQHHLPWGVVTNKPAYLAEQLLHKFSLATQCACLIGGDTLSKRKPDPAPLLHACEIINCDVAECIYVGDAERDIIAAKNARITAVAALYGYIGTLEDPQIWQADYYIEQPQQIIKILTDN